MPWVRRWNRFLDRFDHRTDNIDLVGVGAHYDTDAVHWSRCCLGASCLDSLPLPPIAGLFTFPSTTACRFWARAEQSNIRMEDRYGIQRLLFNHRKLPRVLASTVQVTRGWNLRRRRGNTRRWNLTPLPYDAGARFRALAVGYLISRTVERYCQPQAVARWQT